MERILGSNKRMFSSKLWRAVLTETITDFRLTTEKCIAFKQIS